MICVKYSTSKKQDDIIKRIQIIYNDTEIHRNLEC